MAAVMRMMELPGALEHCDRESRSAVVPYQKAAKIVNQSAIVSRHLRGVTATHFGICLRLDGPVLSQNILPHSGFHFWLSFENFL